MAPARGTLRREYLTQIARSRQVQLTAGRQRSPIRIQPRRGKAKGRDIEGRVLDIQHENAPLVE